MKARAAVISLCTAAALAVGCGAATRRGILSVFFDGVPGPKPETPSAPARPGASGPGAAVPARAGSEHGPYAAKLCGACHSSAATNALVAAKEEICYVCHRLRLDKKYVHGPLASGGCLICHDPHSSRYRHLLVSDAAEFCFHCHDRESVSKVEAHSGVDQACTECHDAHMSDNEHLLR